MQFSCKTQGGIVALISIIIVLIIETGCITDSSTSLKSVSYSNRLYSPQEVTSNSLEPLLNNSSLFILSFYYPGCGACKSMNNTTSQLSNELQGQVRFGRMNVREKENSQTVKKYKVSAYPTLLFFDKGVLVDRMKGDVSKSDILAKLKEIRPGLDASKVNFQSASASTSSTISLAKPKLTPEQACANITKSDHPLLEAYVVSKCPYGLQMQRIMGEIVNKAPQAKDYLMVRYIGSVSNNTITSMHGD